MNTILLFNWQDAANFATVLASIFGLIGVAVVIFQLQQQKRINDADFFLKLFAEFRTYGDLFTTTHFWEKGKREFNEAKNKGLIVSYLGFFESLYHFVNKGVLSLKVVDDSFSYSFFTFVNNEQIQNMELIPCAEDYKNIYRLYALWKPYHLKAGKRIPTLNGKELDTLEEYKLIVNEKE